MRSLLAWVQREPVRFVSILIALVPGVVALVNWLGLGVDEDGSTAILNLLNTILVLVGGQVARSKVTPADHSDADVRDVPPTDEDDVEVGPVTGADPDEPRYYIAPGCWADKSGNGEWPRVL